MCKSTSAQGKKHPYDIALAKALDLSLSQAKRENGISASWVAEYCLKIAPSTLHKYRSLDEPDTIPARYFPIVAGACQNTILLDALATMYAIPEECRPLPDLVGDLAQRCGKTIQVILQGLNPEGPGGAKITPLERREVYESILSLETIVKSIVDATR